VKHVVFLRRRLGDKALMGSKASAVPSQK
jgi:hypothetical protein